MPSWDVFNSDAFSMQTLTASILKAPYKPGRIGELGIFRERGVATTAVSIEEKDGVLQLVTSSPRGGVGNQLTVQKATGRSFRIPHFELVHYMNADEVQNLRAWGSENNLAAVQQVLDLRSADLAASMDVTIEYLMLGALKGTILDGDGTSTLFNLFTEFNVSQETEIAFDFSGHSTDDGHLRQQANAIVRKTQDNLGAATFDHIHALCGKDFWDEFTECAEIANRFKDFTTAIAVQQAGSFMRDGRVRKPPFPYGDILWEELRGSIGGVDFIAADKAIFFPVGVTPNVYELYYAPADTWDAVNTLGLPRYLRQYPSPDGKARVLEGQTNPLPICLRPKVLMKGTKDT